MDYWKAKADDGSWRVGKGTKDVANFEHKCDAELFVATANRRERLKAEFHKPADADCHAQPA